MKITSRERDGVTILELKAKITIGLGDVEMRNAVHAQLEAGHKNLLLDLAGVTTMDSSGVGELVSF
jgi:anti-sigma B factor antagonist